MTTGRTRLAGLLGCPVDHSKSPRLHSAWATRYGIDAVYLPLPVAPTDLGLVLRALPRLGFVGVNVTVPHKQSVLPLLDHLTPAAQQIGAVNMITMDQDGTLAGDNTDATGFLLNLRETQTTFHAQAGPIALLGAGGAARAVVSALLSDGAREIRLFNRSGEKAEKLAAEFGPAVRAMPWAEREAGLNGVCLLINSTSLGMQGQPPLELRLDDLPASALVNDLVYAPLKTDLLRAAQARGNRIADGLGMLLHQARPCFHAWFGVMPDIDAEIRALMVAP
jgi:shikimate dehydrogenase